MKGIILSILCSVTLFVNAQTPDKTFATTTTLPLDLDAGTSYASCTSPGTKAFDFTVTGVGTLSATNALKQIKIQFDASCGGNLRDIVGYIKSPNGTCIKIYTGNSATPTMGTSWSSTSINIILTNPSTCLTAPNASNLPTGSLTSATSSSNYGFFSTGNDLVSTFNNESANGTWSIYWFENVTTAPCIKSLSIVFGDPVVNNRLTDGDNCSNPLQWGGDPICASTNSKTGSNQMPGSLSGAGGASFGTIGGATCSWNSANNNDVWIEFTPRNQTTCIGISGLQFNLQSIVVTDANQDADNNPCTGTAPSAGNDPRWTIVSCPRDNVYNSPSGSQRNQNHCFTSVPGKKYFLVVDGNGGAESPFYISGTLGDFDAGPLPVTLLSFTASLINGNTNLKWVTETELNNKVFIIERSTNGRTWESIKEVSGAGTSYIRNNYFQIDENTPSGTVYYRIKQVDFDGSYSYSGIQIVRNNKSRVINVLPNPSNGLYVLQGLNKTKDNFIKIYDGTGKVILSKNTKIDNFKIDLTSFADGIYYLNVNSDNEYSVQKLIKRSK